MSHPSQRPPLSALAEQILATSWLEDGLAIPKLAPLGRYQPLRLLGEGATSQVLLAEDPLMKRLVAIKLLGAGEGLSEDRFAREVQILAEFRHPNVVQVHDVGHDASGRPYLVMEFGGTQTLATANLDLRDAVQALQKVAEACAYAHERGVVHRDLKPANILIGERPLVTDFGIAKLAGGDARLTRTGALVGTPAYMSPEQALQGEVSPLTDVYALGVMLYQELCGQTPYEGAETLVELIHSLKKGAFPSPADLAPQAPAPLVALCLEALRTSPDQRPSAAEFAERCQAWLEQAEPAAATEQGALRVALGAFLVLGLGLTVLVSSHSAESPPPPSRSQPLAEAASPQAASPEPTGPKPTAPASGPLGGAVARPGTPQEDWEARLVSRCLGFAEPDPKKALAAEDLSPTLRALITHDLKAAQQGVWSWKSPDTARRDLYAAQIALLRGDLERAAGLFREAKSTSASLGLALVELRRAETKPSMESAVQLLTQVELLLAQERPGALSLAISSASCRWLVRVTLAYRRPAPQPLQEALRKLEARLAEPASSPDDVCRWRWEAARGDVLLATWARAAKTPSTRAAARRHLEAAQGEAPLEPGPLLSLALWHMTATPLSPAEHAAGQRRLKAALSLAPDSPEAAALRAIELRRR